MSRGLRPRWSDRVGLTPEEAIAAVEALPDPRVGEFVKRILEERDPRRHRDAALRRAALYVEATSISGRAKALVDVIDLYLPNGWLRERDVAILSADASPLRRDLHRVARLTGGNGVAWRTVLEVIEK